jgi:hypothetical protein
MIFIKIHIRAHPSFDPCFYAIRKAGPKVGIHELKDSKTVKAQELLRMRAPPNFFVIVQKVSCSTSSQSMSKHPPFATQKKK